MPRHLTIVIGLVLVASAAAHAATVRIRGAARVPADRAITLADIASIEGAGADRIAGIIVEATPAEAANGAGRITVDVAQVRRMMAEAGVSLGRHTLSGGRCTVRLIEPRREQPEADAPEPVRQPEVLTRLSDNTVRQHVADRLMELFEAQPGTIRVLFDESDEALLAMTGVGNRIEVRPRTTGNSARALVDVRVLAGGRTVASGTVGAEVELHQPALIAADRIDRNQVITGEEVRQTSLWVSPHGSPVLEGMDELADKRARRRIRAGTILREADFEQAIVVQRGELVSVLCVRGGVGVTTKARALADGRMGEQIECRKTSGSEPFVATVDGPGLLVLCLDPAAEPGADR